MNDVPGTETQTGDEGAKPAHQVVDIKQGQPAPAQMVFTNGAVQETGGQENFLRTLLGGNITIDPGLLAQNHADGGAQPLTISEAIMKGDYTAAANMLVAKVQRAQNGDFDGNDDSLAQYMKKHHITEALPVFDTAKEQAKQEEALRQYLDKDGGYRNRKGGYYNAQAGTYTDEHGGTVDNWGGYTYKDGSYKSAMGDYYDAKTNTLRTTDGDSVSGVRADQAIKIMRQDSAEQGHYDPHMVASSMMQSVKNEHAPDAGAKPGEGPAEAIAAKAFAEHGPSAAPPVVPGGVAKSRSSLADRMRAVSQASGAAPQVSGSAPAAPVAEAPPVTKFTAGTPTASAIDPGTAGSHFLPADPPGGSKFAVVTPGAGADTTTPDPATPATVTPAASAAPPPVTPAASAVARAAAKPPGP